MDDAFDRGRRTFRAAFFASIAISSRLASAIPDTARVYAGAASSRCTVRIPSATSNSVGIICANSLACAGPPDTRVPFAM